MSCRLLAAIAVALSLTGCAGRMPIGTGADPDPEPILVKTACPVTPPPRCEELRQATRLSELQYGRRRCITELDSRQQEWKDCGDN